MRKNIWLAIRINLALLFIALVIAAGACSKDASAAPLQPVVPKGHFKICVFDWKGNPVAGWEWSAEVSTGEVVYGPTDQDGCHGDEIVAGPATFEVGTGVKEEVNIREDESVYIEFYLPAPHENHLPFLAHSKP